MKPEKVITVMCAARLPEILVKRLDVRASELGRSRASLIEFAVSQFLDRSTVPIVLYKEKQQAGAKEEIEPMSMPNLPPRGDELIKESDMRCAMRDNSSPKPTPTKIQALKDICAGKPDVEPIMPVVEIRMCLRHNFNEINGETYECHQDFGHKGKCTAGRQL